MRAPPMLLRSVTAAVLFAGSISPCASQEAEPRRVVVTNCFNSEEAARSCAAFRAGLRDSEAEVRGEIVRLTVAKGFVIANCGASDPLLLELLQTSRDPEVRRAAARLLGESGKQGGAVEACVRLLADPDETIRRQAVEDLGGLFKWAIVLSKELDLLSAHPSVEVRRAVAQAFRNLGLPLPSALAAEELPPLPPAPAQARSVGASLELPEAERLWERLVQSDAVPEESLRQLDEHFLLFGQPKAEVRRAQAERWLKRVAPADRARLRARLYLWSAGRWQVPG